VSSTIRGSSATRRKPARVRRGPAKIIAMPTPTVVRRRRAIKAGMGLLLASLVSVAALRIYLARTAPPPPEQLAGLTALEAEILQRVNDERIKAGKPALKLSARLAVVARGHSYDMAMRRYLAHASPEGTGPAERVGGVGIGYQALGENVYMDEDRDTGGLARRAVDAWLKSPEHRENLLSPQFTETGVGVARSSEGSFYVTQDFVR
jgi:uncharacterized protein YkwD